MESKGDTCGLTDPSDQVSVSPASLGLGPLQDNGGRTETHALLADSVAIEAADCPPPDDDQRGVSRVGLGACDSGAFEFAPCNDFVDNDGDVDYPDDIGCKNAGWKTENPECDDGVDNTDNDDPPLADWDGAGLGDPDPQCAAPWDKSESPTVMQCGGGAELALLLPPLMWLFGRRRRRV